MFKKTLFCLLMVELTICVNVPFPSDTSNFRLRSFIGDGVGVGYPGQSNVGDGKISKDRIGDYVSTRYPSYKFVESYSIDSSLYEPILQRSTSYYLKRYNDYKVNGSAYTTPEGNCALTAVYMVLKNWESNGLIHTAPGYEDLSESITNDYFYPNCENENYSMDLKYGAYGWIPNLEEGTGLYHMPYFYTIIRGYARTLGYDPEKGFSYSNVKLLMMNVLLNVGNFGFGISEDGDSNENTISNVKKGLASFVAIYSSATYGNHGAAVVGYSKYTYTSSGRTEDKYFYEICDCWNVESMYFDPNTNAGPMLYFVSK